MGRAARVWRVVAPRATSSALATCAAIPDWTWKTSVSGASNGCCHLLAGAPLGPTSMSCLRPTMEAGTPE